MLPRADLRKLGLPFACFHGGKRADRVVKMKEEVYHHHHIGDKLEKKSVHLGFFHIKFTYCQTN